MSKPLSLNMEDKVRLDTNRKLKSEGEAGDKKASKPTAKTMVMIRNEKIALMRQWSSLPVQQVVPPTEFLHKEQLVSRHLASESSEAEKRESNEKIKAVKVSKGEKGHFRTALPQKEGETLLPAALFKRKKLGDTKTYRHGKFMSFHQSLDMPDSCGPFSVTAGILSNVDTCGLLPQLRRWNYKSQMSIGLDDGAVIYPSTFTLQKILSVGIIKCRETYLQCPSSVVITQDGSIAVGDEKTRRIVIFHDDGHYKRHFNVLGEYGFIPGPMATTPQGDIAVIDTRNKRVVVISSQDGSTKLDFGKRELVWPSGIAVTSDGNILVSDWDRHCIRVYTSNGGYSSNIGSQGDGPGQLIYPWLLAVNSSDDIIVSDTGNNRIQILNVDGRHLKEIRLEDQLIVPPRGLSVDRENNIYVCSNYGIFLIIAETMKCVRVEMNRERLLWPRGLAVTMEIPPKLSVTHDRVLSPYSPGMLTVFKVLPKFPDVR
ncbi:B-box type zinc finger protein ncl-1-like [Ptychodera flava]|uniref:B-box type zinc finger protein ncl-1-like n=1 Tax=Ptychodera flava TaxID=63121 RepID=UPI00396A30DC